MDIHSIRVSRFANYKANRTNGQVNLWDWLLRKNAHTSTVYKIRSIADEAEIRSLKAGLPAVTISCICEKRKADAVLEHTGLICIDIDGKDNPEITDMGQLKSRLSILEYVLYCGLSVSGKGLFCIIPIANSDMHKQHFYALERDFKEMRIIIDQACHDVCRLRGYSYDEKAYVNPGARTYAATLERRNSVFQQDNIKENAYTPKLLKEDIQVEKQSAQDFLFQTHTDYNSVLVVSKTEQVGLLIHRIVEYGIDITCVYADWIAICHIIKNLFDEDGRALFHQISSFYPNYDFDEADHKYSSVVRWRYKYNSDRIFEIAAKYGVS